MSSGKHDPATYRAMNVPFADDAAANVAVQAFFTGIEALRREHKIPDVLVIVECATMTGDVETRGTAQLSLGDSRNTMPMIARAYGEARQIHEDQLALLIQRGRKSKEAR